MLISEIRQIQIIPLSLNLHAVLLMTTKYSFDNSAEKISRFIQIKLSKKHILVILECITDRSNKETRNEDKKMFPVLDNCGLDPSIPFLFWSLILDQYKAFEIILYE